MENRVFTILFSTIFQDAGEATRAIEIAKNLTKYKPDGMKIRIIFISRGSRFEQRALDLGFEIYRAKPALDGIGVLHDLKMKPGNLVGDTQLAADLLFGEIAAYKEIKPDIVIYGFWPIGGIARRMFDPAVPGVCFLPLPLTEALLDDVSDMPEQMRVPALIRKQAIKLIPKSARQRLPLLRHSTIRAAARRLGWCGEPLINIFCMLRADMTIVNDLPDYYNVQKYPENVRFTGPLFAKTPETAAIDPKILEVFRADTGKIKVFCTLGSSGAKEQLFEIINVFTGGEGLNWNAVILAPPSVCGLQEARALAGGRPGVYITDKFVPAQQVNALADITICHGGQGTVQTALSSGTPIVTFAMQPEQQMNLDHAAARGAAIRIPARQWRANAIRTAVCRIISDAHYKQSAALLMDKICDIDGGKESALAIWSKIMELTDINKPRASISA